MTRTATLTFGGRTVELPVVEGSEGELAVDISQLRAETGLITLDPGFGNTGACESAITFIDGEKGILRYRGIPIEQLAEHSTFVEAAWLLIYGRLPDRGRAGPLQRAADAPRVAARGVQAPLRGLPGQRPADGHALGDDQHPGLLPPRYLEDVDEEVLRGGGAADQQGAHDRRLLLSPVDRACRSSIPTPSCATSPTSCT